jgi:hypothetical protein
VESKGRDRQRPRAPATLSPEVSGGVLSALSAPVVAGPQKTQYRATRAQQARGESAIHRHRMSAPVVMIETSELVIE